jgi:hypothetical protein
VGGRHVFACCVGKFDRLLEAFFPPTSGVMACAIAAGDRSGWQSCSAHSDAHCVGGCQGSITSCRGGPSGCLSAPLPPTCLHALLIT